MRGLMSEQKSRLNPALKIGFIGAIAVLGLWFILRRFQIEVAFTSAPPDQAPVIQTESGKAPVVQSGTGIAGNLRISNQSVHPIRVALRARPLKESGSKDATEKTFAAPAHWDFEPGEGSTGGLMVSLPDRAIKLKKGDVLVAFAQDGSQRYWGPYIVGETDQPNWNSQTNEWELTLNK
jgi:hypothetical protein